MPYLRSTTFADFCTCHSWLPLLFIPTNASPSFIFLFFVATYFLNRPCIYCSALLLILFLSSCTWADRCFFDFNSNWFEPRSVAPSTASSAAGCCADCIHKGIAERGLEGVNATCSTIAMAAQDWNMTAAAAAESVLDAAAKTKAEWTGLGMEWLRSLLGRREWRVECLDLYIRL